ncbi:MAG: fused MFS/spermidine synthase, partial [Planctomycetaceae bacterium]|nr:fused MFS/spermidine synthase [Planctomycetaceae bacterium]
STQAMFWTVGFLGLALLCATCGWVAALIRNRATDNPALVTDELQPVPQETAAPTGGKWWQWFVLSMTASVMLLATTNQVCQDVAVVPFLWVVPLSLYLLTFILCFDSERWYSRIGFGLAGAFSAGWAAFLMISPEAFGFFVQIVIYFSALFTTGMVCHGELARLKPEPARLTGFYLTLAAGGATGGMFVGVVAPLIFPLFFEMHLALTLCVTLSVGVYFHETRQRNTVHNFHKIAILCSLVGVIGVVFVLGKDVRELVGSSSQVERNFYGVIRLKDIDSDNPDLHKKRLLHGRILHGFQFQSPEKSMWPTTYYGPDSGVGRTFQILHDQRSQLKVGVVGLGTGTLSAYGREGDEFRYYEINEAIVRVATEDFTFVKQSPAKTEIVLGDARLQLEREDDQKFDLLILDAFSGDSIPAHLLSAEAMEIYDRHLAPDGVLAIHFSNLHFDLSPVLVGLADVSHLQSRLTTGRTDLETGQNASQWFIASRDGAILQEEAYADLKWDMPERRILWTDDFSNLFSVLR